jgi:AcrR family transcriptional regulator
MTESATRTRTRQAILAAAVTVFARDPSASLGEVAAAAGVGRTTLHRYFAERSDLLSALVVHVLEAVAAATERAAPGHGPAPEALGRICREYFELGDVLTVLFNEPSGIGAEVGTREEWEHDRQLAALIARGQAEGSIDPALTPAWLQSMMWALLYTAWSLMREQCVPRHEALEQCLRSLHKAVAAV